MKTIFIYTIFTILFLVPPVLPRNVAKAKVAPATKKESIVEYTNALDSALVSARKRNKTLRQKCLNQVQLLVIQQDGNRMEKDIHRLAGN